MSESFPEEYSVRKYPNGRVELLGYESKQEGIGTDDDDNDGEDDDDKEHEANPEEPDADGTGKDPSEERSQSGKGFVVTKDPPEIIRAFLLVQLKHELNFRGVLHYHLQGRSAADLKDTVVYQAVCLFSHRVIRVIRVRLLLIICNIIWMISQDYLAHCLYVLLFVYVGTGFSGSPVRNLQTWLTQRTNVISKKNVGQNRRCL
jgi:hypothetical protein